jgi:hypothetical protein
LRDQKELPDINNTGLADEKYVGFMGKAILIFKQLKTNYT